MFHTEKDVRQSKGSTQPWYMVVMDGVSIKSVIFNSLKEEYKI